MRAIADQIINESIAQVLPDKAVERALADCQFQGNLYLVAIGKAGWRMAAKACELLGDAIAAGAVVTKYDHVEGPLPNIRCFEAGHPVPDENSFSATRYVLDLVSQAGEGDTVLFLVSGGGSALFELPQIEGGELARITQELLAGGADITEMNAVRKHLSCVKGGRFAQACAPAQVFQVVLSDVLGNRLDTIASGPAAADASTSEEAQAVIERYGIEMSAAARAALERETPKALDNVKTVIAGGVETLCEAAAQACKRQGFEPHLLTTNLTCEAADAGRDLAQQALDLRKLGKGRHALLAGGETIVHVTGTGLGGRNQELALAAAEVLDGVEGIALFSVGSDGTDGPTDAAGGYVDGCTWSALTAAGMDPYAALANNDAYHALERCSGLVITGPTGTNVNDIAIVLVDNS